MESLVKVASGDDNVAVGISGFGSARVGSGRWADLARLTGRTTYYLSYDAQELPWAAGEAITWTLQIYHEMQRRFSQARQGAQVAASYLAKWLTRWARAGRKVLLIGFSLGAYVAWLAVQQVPDELKGQIELVMMSAAVADKMDTWKGMEKVGRVVNSFSKLDMSLRYLYPQAVDTDETPAAGLGPLVVSPLNNLFNLDMTDVIGRDHLYGTKNMGRLIRVSLGVLWSMSPSLPEGCAEDRCVEKHLSADEAERLYRWAFIDMDLWRMVGRALDGSPSSIQRVKDIDEWSVDSARLSALLDAGVAFAALDEAKVGLSSSKRGQSTLRGMLRSWMMGSPRLGFSPHGEAVDLGPIHRSLEPQES